MVQLNSQQVFRQPERFLLLFNSYEYYYVTNIQFFFKIFGLISNHGSSLLTTGFSIALKVVFTLSSQLKPLIMWQNFTNYNKILIFNKFYWVMRSNR